MSVQTGTTGFRVVCDRLGCSGVLHHQSFLEEEDDEDWPLQAIRKHWPPLDDEGRHLCEACAERKAAGTLQVTWKQKEPEMLRLRRRA